MSLPNKRRGEVAIKDGKRTYVMRFTINTICALEEETGRSLQELGTAVTDGSMRTARLLVWAALRDQQPELTLEDAGELMTRVGLEPMTAALMDAMAAAFPAPPVAAVKSA